MELAMATAATAQVHASYKQSLEKLPTFANWTALSLYSRGTSERAILQVGRGPPVTLPRVEPSTALQLSHDYVRVSQKQLSSVVRLTTSVPGRPSRAAGPR